MADDVDNVIEEMGKEPLTGIRVRSRRPISMTKAETVYVNVSESVFTSDFHPDNVQVMTTICDLSK